MAGRTIVRGIAALAVVGCTSNMEPTSAGATQGAPDFPGSSAAAGITIVNATADSLGFLSWGWEAAALIDLRPHLPAHHLAARAAPSDSGMLLREAISEYRPGSGAMLFVYRVREGEGAVRGHLSLSAAQLTRSDVRIVISDFLLAAPPR